MNYPPLNEKLLDCVLKHIEEHPEDHNQNIWLSIGEDKGSCGAIGCVAGWACLLTLPEDVSYEDFAEGVDTGSWNFKDNNKPHVWTIAREKLGLTFNEAKTLFRAAESGLGSSPLEQIKSRIATIKKNRGLQ